jgi:hypothetical protein
MEFLRNDHNWIFGPTRETGPIIINSGRWSNENTENSWPYKFFSSHFFHHDQVLTVVWPPTYMCPTCLVFSITPSPPHRSSHRSKPSTNPTTSGWYATVVAPWRPSIKGEYRSLFSTTSEPDLHSSFKPPSPSFSSGCSFGTHANHLHHLWHSASRRLSVISSVTQRKSLEQGHRKDPTRCCQPWLIFWRCLILSAGL